MNAKIALFVTFVEAIIYLLFINLDDCTFEVLKNLQISSGFYIKICRSLKLVSHQTIAFNFITELAINLNLSPN